MALSMFIAAVGGIIPGFISAVRQGSIFDMVCMGGAVMGVSIPNFWLGLMLLYLFGVILGILPTVGYGNGDFAHLILPSVTLGAAYMALIARTSRAAVLDVINEDYVKTARSKGLSELVVRVKHIFRNALIPIITIIGLQFGGMLANTVVVETVFAWPGVGSLLVISIFRRDVPAIQGCILLIILSFLVINLLVDILYAYIDPRIHY
jgi:peptide/nickel transport system permease protein